MKLTRFDKLLIGIVSWIVGIATIILSMQPAGLNQSTSNIQGKFAQSGLPFHSGILRAIRAGISIVGNPARCVSGPPPREFPSQYDEQAKNSSWCCDEKGNCTRGGPASYLVGDPTILCPNLTVTLPIHHYYAGDTGYLGMFHGKENQLTIRYFTLGGNAIPDQNKPDSLQKYENAVANTDFCPLDHTHRFPSTDNLNIALKTLENAQAVDPRLMFLAIMDEATKKLISTIPVVIHPRSKPCLLNREKWGNHLSNNFLSLQMPFINRPC